MKPLYTLSASESMPGKAAKGEAKIATAGAEAAIGKATGTR